MIHRWAAFAAVSIGLGCVTGAASAQTTENFAGQVVGLSTTVAAWSSYSVQTNVATGYSRALGPIAMAEFEVVDDSSDPSAAVYGFGSIQLSDGAEIYYYFEGSGLVGDDGLVDLDIEATIFGGTGDYNLATGSFTLTGTLNPNSGVYSGAISGSVTPP